MSALLRWIRKLQGYAPLKDHKTRGVNRQTREKQEQEKQEQERQEQQQAQMLLTLHELQRTMDPLVAAQVYNKSFSRLARLPEELLLIILESLSNDAPTLHSLRIVSRTFFRLTYHPCIWRHICHTYFLGSPHPVPNIGQVLFLRFDMRKPLRLLLERDGQCDNCRRWGEAHPPQGNALTNRCKFLPFQFEKHCIIFNNLYCHACSNPHSRHQFSPFSQPDGRRQCLGHQGSVKLCEHVHINWASIRDYISDWQQRKPEDWHTFLDSFSIECHDPSHDMRCSAEEAPTWPRARLQIAKSNSDLVVLNLEWAPHSGLDALTATADACLSVSDLRALFQKFRRGPADILFPSNRPDYFPELACFNQRLGTSHYVQYETGDNKRPMSAATKALISQSRLRFAFNFICYYNTRYYGYGKNGQRIDIKAHCRQDTSNASKSTCLIAIYQCDILVCKTTDRTTINPTHEWLHAMDPDTYHHPQASHVRPLCKDETCMNYYRTRRLSPSCCDWPILLYEDMPFHLRRRLRPPTTPMW
jgi:hypothetical protein